MTDAGEPSLLDTAAREYETLAYSAETGRGWLDLARHSLMGVIAVAALALGLLLWFGASNTGNFFAWTIKSSTAASALGGFYVGVAAYAVVAARALRWDTARPILPAAIAGPVLLLIPTALHHDLFDFGHSIAWLWLVLYIVFPPMLLALYVMSERSAPRRDSPEQHPMRWNRGVVGLGGVALGVLGLVLLVSPTALASVWGWPLTPLIGQVYGCWILAAAITTIALLIERSWTTLRPVLRAQLVGATAIAIGPLLHPGQLRLNGASIIWVLGFMTIALYSGVWLWLNRSHPRIAS